MKGILLGLILVLAPAIAWGQTDMKCSSLTGLTVAPDIHEVCTFPDGSGVEIETISGTYYRTEYSADKWAARYATLIKADTDSLKDAASIQAVYLKSYKLTTKKACTAAGEPYYWKDHICNVREPLPALAAVKQP